MKSWTVQTHTLGSPNSHTRYEVLDSPNSHTRYEVLDSPMQFLLHVSSDMKLTYDFLPKSMYI